MADAHFEALRLKYRSVLEAIDRLGGRLEALDMDSGRLRMRAVAPSLEAEARLWDEIKEVDPSYTDLVPEIRSAEPLAVRPATANGPDGTTDLYTVQPGDTLRRIAANYYGDAGMFGRIFEANRERMRDPDDLRPGQRLVIPID